MADETNGAAAEEFEEDHIPSYKLNDIKGAIRDAFDEIYAEDCEIAAIQQGDLKDHQKSKTKLWRTLKADTTIPREDLKHLYAIYKRLRDAEDSEDTDADVIRDNIRLAFEALAEGETVDFISVSGLMEPAPAPAKA